VRVGFCDARGLCALEAKAAALIKLNIQGCCVVAPPMYAPLRAPLLLPLLLSHNLPLPRVHYCVMGRFFLAGDSPPSPIA
jgi:hypothetical protein